MSGRIESRLRKLERKGAPAESVLSRILKNIDGKTRGLPSVRGPKVLDGNSDFEELLKWAARTCFAELEKKLGPHIFEARLDMKSK